MTTSPHLTVRVEVTPDALACSIPEIWKTVSPLLEGKHVTSPQQANNRRKAQKLGIYTLSSPNPTLRSRWTCDQFENGSQRAFSKGTSTAHHRAFILRNCPGSPGTCQRS